MTSVELSTSARLDNNKKNQKSWHTQAQHTTIPTLPVFEWFGVEGAHILYFLWREKIIFKITKHQKSIDWWFTVKHTSTNAEVKLTNNTHTHAEVSARGWWTTHLYVDVWEEKLMVTGVNNGRMVGAGKHIAGAFRLEQSSRIIGFVPNTTFLPESSWPGKKQNHIKNDTKIQF